MIEFTEREQKEIALARHYAIDPHGTDGHTRLLLIAKLADRVDELQRAQKKSEQIPYTDQKEVPPSIIPPYKPLPNHTTLQPRIQFRCWRCGKVFSGQEWQTHHYTCPPYTLS